jgi:hypothetical protein
MTAPVQLSFDLDWCQRWSPAGEQRWQHPRYSRFDKTRYGVDKVDVAVARAFVVQHHYSRAWCAPKLCYGLFDLAGQVPRLVGAAVLSIPVKSVITRAFPTLTAFYESVDLGKFVLLDEVPANGESWFLTEVFRLAAKAGIRGIVSFADPVARTTLATEDTPSETLFGGHIGEVYGLAMGSQNGRSGFGYTGRSDRSYKILMPDGRVFNEQARSKLLNRRVGWEYAARFLAGYGARPLRDGENPRTWLPEALDAAHARRLEHGGQHRYLRVIGTTKPARAAVRIGLPLLEPPRRLIAA